MSHILKLNGIDNTLKRSNATFFNAVSSFNVVFSDMSDDFLSLIIDRQICIWIGTKGQIGEIETISSSYMDNQKLILDHIIEKKGTPLFSVIEDLYDKAINLQLRKDNHTFSLFWGNQAEECMVVRSNGSTFFIQEDLLVGVEVEGYSIE